MEAFPRFPIEIEQSSLHVPILDYLKQWLPNLTMSVKPNHDFSGSGGEQYPIAKRKRRTHDGSNG